MASVFIVNRLKSSFPYRNEYFRQLATDSALPLGSSKNLPTALSSDTPSWGIVKRKPGGRGASSNARREKVKPAILNNMTRFAGTFEIPVYAIGYLANDDPSGLTDAEVELINGFVDSYFPNGYSVDWDSVDEQYFSSSPAFGPGATVCEAKFYAN